MSTNKFSHCPAQTPIAVEGDVTRHRRPAERFGNAVDASNTPEQTTIVEDATDASDTVESVNGVEEKDNDVNVITEQVVTLPNHGGQTTNDNNFFQKFENINNLISDSTSSGIGINHGFSTGGSVNLNYYNPQTTLHDNVSRNTDLQGNTVDFDVMQYRLEHDNSMRSIWNQLQNENDAIEDVDNPFCFPSSIQSNHPVAGSNCIVQNNGNNVGSLITSPPNPAFLISLIARQNAIVGAVTNNNNPVPPQAPANVQGSGGFFILPYYDPSTGQTSHVPFPFPISGQQNTTTGFQGMAELTCIHPSQLHGFNVAGGSVNASVQQQQPTLVPENSQGYRYIPFLGGDIPIPNPTNLPPVDNASALQQQLEKFVPGNFQGGSIPTPMGQLAYSNPNTNFEGSDMSGGAPIPNPTNLPPVNRNWSQPIPLASRVPSKRSLHEDADTQSTHSESRPWKRQDRGQWRTAAYTHPHSLKERKSTPPYVKIGNKHYICNYLGPAEVPESRICGQPLLTGVRNRKRHMAKHAEREDDMIKTRTITIDEAHALFWTKKILFKCAFCNYQVLVWRMDGVGEEHEAKEHPKIFADRFKKTKGKGKGKEREEEEDDSYGETDDDLYA